MASLTDRITVADRVLFRDLGGEAVLLEMAAGMYYGLNEVGTRMWHLLAEHGRGESVYRSLLDEYDVAPDRLRSELLGFLDELASRGLVHFHET